jgi:hypothetical protein
MSEYSRQIYVGVTIAVLVTAFVAVELYDLDSPGTSTSASQSLGNMSTPAVTIISTSSLNSGPPWVYTSGVSSDGLQLRVTLNSTAIHSHEALGAEIQVINTFNHSVSVQMPLASTVESGDIYTWSLLDQVCAGNPSDFTVAFALFQGHYSPANVSSGTQLVEAPLAVELCGAGFNPPSAVMFHQNSDLTNYTFKAEVNATTYYCNLNDCNNTSGLLGYWNSPPTRVEAADLNYSSSAFSYFSPGEYTIVATDAWDQYVYVTFLVM